ncbi:MAG: 50S ribosomal protein L3 [Phycisphaerae bacterium]|nr:50S ribosomal protein L3 [Phycisphaerae bacterium]
MAIAILGRKVGMTRFYDEQGVCHPCTVVQAGPCTVLQVKSDETDGYRAVQIGLGVRKPHRATKPMIGHAAKAGVAAPEAVREFRQNDGDPQLDVGGQITVSDFSEVRWVDVTGTTKGKGFAGVMKRHNFGGQPASHGTERKHRSPGSIASHATNRGFSGRPKKGKRMAGQLGNTRCTERNLRLLGVDAEKNLLLIRGAIPGANGGLVTVRTSRTKGA